MVVLRKLGRAPAALVLGLGTAACHESHHHGPPPPPVYSFVELEPNNGASSANYLGSLAIGETFLVRGFIEDSGLDPFDGFAITAAEPLEVEFHLWIDDAFSDLDVCYFNPYSGQTEACFETSQNPESGWLALYGGTDFHLVVSSYFGDSSYTLELIGRPLGYAPSAAARPATRARAVPFEAYASPGAAPEAATEPVEVRARGRWILLDLEDGSSASQEFEIGAGGLRAGPLLGSLRGA